MNREEIYEKISSELERAYSKHGKQKWNRHEFYGIIKEEFDEMWEDIKSDAPLEQLDKEIIQVTAMCFRYLENRIKQL